MDKYDVLEKLCKPIKQYLDENYNPHCAVVITSDNVKIVENIVSVPFDWKTK